VTVAFRALSVGPAASPALSMPRATARLHSLFPSTVNLAVEAVDVLVALTGPSGSCYPHAVVLEQVVAFPALGFSPGDAVHVSPEEIRLQGRRGAAVVTLRGARRPHRRALPVIAPRGEAWRAAVRRLDEMQSRSSFDLRLSALVTGPVAGSARAAALQRSARALGGARPGARLFKAVSALVGAGTGLTPSGDDFLSGLMAASRATRNAGLARALCEAVRENLAATGDISASLLRCAVGGHWVGPLVDLADALSADDRSAALSSIDTLCGLGHSSGSDIATGFLFGLATLPKASP